MNRGNNLILGFKGLKHCSNTAGSWVRIPFKSIFSSFSEVPSTLGNFSNLVFLTRIRVDGALVNQSGERFQRDAVSVRGITGFVWKECKFV